MVGFCGILGNPQHDIDAVGHTIEWSENENGDIFRDDSAQIFHLTHRESDAYQPESAGGGQLLWIWGDVIGFEDSTGYTPRDNQEQSDAAYCASLLESHGPSFVEGLNSEFAGVILDRDRAEATLFTDRLGARPIYFTDELDDSVLFSTHLNSILTHPAFEPSIDDELLSEFLKLERTFGIYTPFEGVYQLHPGSTLTVDLETVSTSFDRYWMPQYRPMDRPYDEHVREFSSIIQRSVEERSNPSANDGLFVSGGSDSRLLLSLLADDVTGYHLNDSMNTEADIARNACETAGVTFRFLKREPDYLTDVLERVGDFQLFQSFFDQAHFAGFEDKITDEIDAVFSGHTADTILEGFYLPTREVPVPYLGWTIPLPVLEPVESVSSYAEYIVNDYQYHRGSSTNIQPDYVALEKSPVTVLREYMTESDDGIVHHGVKYPSLDALAHAGGFYPITNNKAYFTYYTLNQMLPTHYPFLDNRVIEFSLSVPHRYHARRSVVNRTLTERNRALAEIPKAGIGLPLTYPRTVYSAAELWRSFKNNIIPESESSGGSWSDNALVLRETDIAESYLFNEEYGARTPAMIDWDEVEELYRRHLEGENNYFDLYAVLSLCNSYSAKNDLVAPQ